MQAKYFELTRVADESVARDLRPNDQENERIKEIINLPDFLTMSDQDKAIIWRFRYSLKDNSKALVKFLQSARLTDEKELKEVRNLFKQWQAIELEDALPLLSAKFAANPIYNE